MLFNHNRLLCGWCKELESKLSNREQHISYLNGRRADLNNSLNAQKLTIARLEKNAIDVKPMKAEMAALIVENEQLRQLTNDNFLVAEVARLNSIVQQQQSEIKAMHQALSILK